ncbi:MAG: long-chain fatty acid--CoA ligase [Verrucomicrobia bacterium]|nr:long-chain fatty acid--CoA ligase [Verrucomicrobiota bacterium]
MNYPRITLCEMLEQTTRRSARQAALVYFGTRIRYAELLDQVNRAAAGLQALGVQPGDRVALLMQNCPQFIIAFFGALRAGAIVTPTNPMYTPREAGHQWRDAGVSVVIADRRLSPVVEAARTECPDVRQVVLLGWRDYAPRNYAALKHSLRRTLEFPSNVGTLARADCGAANRGPRAGEAALRLPEPDFVRGAGCRGARRGPFRGLLPPVSNPPVAWRDLLRVGNHPTPVETGTHEVACLQYTGGTTGTAKGAMLTHRNLVSNACQANDWLGIGRHGRETMVAALPLFHVFALTCVMISGIRCGGTVVILPRFELKTALNAVRRYRPTIFHGVPTMYVAFNGVPGVRRHGFRRLRMCMSGGAALPVQVREKFEALTGGKLVEGYGLTETSPVTHINPPNGDIRSGSIGLPIADTEARIMDLKTGTRELPVGAAGEIAIRGPQVMRGYWRQPAETAAVLRDGWLYTGDIAKRDAGGYYYIVDRKKDLIIAGGFNIYPHEVEEVLFQHPRIKEAVVIGVPDAYRGETVKAFVVVKDGQALAPDEIIAFCRERLAAYKVPRLIEFRPSLPKSAVGKYLRRELRQAQRVHSRVAA